MWCIPTYTAPRTKPNKRMQRIDVIIGAAVFAFVAGWLYLLLEVCIYLALGCAAAIIVAAVCAVVSVTFFERRK